MDILKIRLNEDGMCDFAPDFKVMRGGYKDITLQIEVPHSMLVYPALDVDSSYNHTGNNVRIGAIVHTSTGHNIKTKRYEFKRVKDFKVNNIDYRLYQRPMPKEFTMWETVSELEEATPGLLEMIINVVNWTKDENGAKIEEVLPSHFVSVEVHPSTYLDEGEEIESPSDFEILHSQVQEMDAKVEEIDAELDVTTANTNNLLKLAKLKINVSDIKDGVYYSENGYKSPFYEFYPVVYSLPNADGVKVSKECSVVATQMVADSVSPEVVGYQTEYAYADDGVYIRTNKYNISQASIGSYTLLANGEWKLANQQKIEQVAEVASENTKSIEELASHVDEGLASVNTKVDENQTALTNKINTDVNNLSESVNTELAKINKKVDTGTNYIGQYPTRNTMPTNDELNTFASNKMNRAPQRGDEVNFVLQVENGVDKVYTFKYSESDSTWDIIEIPGAELAGNNDAGYIIGTNRAENEEKLISGIVKMLLDIQSGEVKDIKVYNKNIEKIVSLITSVVLYDGENRVLASELYGKDADGSFSYAKLNNNVIEIGDHTKVSLYKGKNKKVYYSWIENGTIKSDSFAYDGDIGDYSLLEGKTIIDYCVDLYNAHVEAKQKLESDIVKLNEAIAAETQRATNALSEESARLEGLVTAETQRAITALNTETERATAAENKLSTDKLNKSNIDENYFKDIVFSLNGDTGVATGTYKNPVSGVETTLEIHVISPASTSSAGLMTADMVTALNKALIDIEALKYEGRQLQVFDTYADAQLFDWSTVGAINTDDYFIVLKDETRVADEKDKTTRYTCISLTAPITTENNFTYSGLVTTVVIQVATESEVGGVLSVNQTGYIYVEPTGAMKLVGYDSIISSIAILNQNLSSEIARAKAAEGTNASAISEERERAQAQELELSNNKADRSELPTKTSELENNGDGTSPFARQSDLPTKLSELNNDANYAKTEQLPTTLSQLQDDIGVADKADKSDLQKDINVNGILKEFTTGFSENELSNKYTWEQQTSPTGFTARQRACVFGNGYYVIAGTSGQLAYSTTLAQWQMITPFTAAVITGLAYGNGYFLAVDSNGNIYRTDSPEKDWENVYVFSGIIESIRYVNNIFVAVGDAGLIAMSSDGSLWKTKTSGVSVSLIDISYGNGKYVAVGAGGTKLVSVNGDIWYNKSDSNYTTDIRTIMYANGQFVIGTSGGRIDYSSDGENWTQSNNPSSLTIGWIRNFTYYANRLYAVMYASNGQGEIWISNDKGKTWNVAQTVAGRLWCIASGNDAFFASGDAGAIYSLDLELDWTDTPLETSNRWYRFKVSQNDGSFIYSDIYVQPSLPTDILVYSKMSLDDNQKTQARENIDAISNVELNTAIAGLGTVFDLKGTKATVSDLPAESNSIGDVWYVVAEEVGYVWLNDGTTDRWEKFGAPIDLSGYVTNETFSEFQTQVQEMSVGMATMVSDVRAELVDMKMDKENPTGTGSFSLNRYADSTIGEYSVAEGINAIASGYASHAEGEGCQATGYASHAGGIASIASGDYSFAYGDDTTASGEVSHAEGQRTTASGDFSHAEGSQTTATSMGSHAEGWGTTASNVGAHAEGQGTTASDAGAHAEGLNTIASGWGSHAEGEKTIASGENQHVFGKCNIEDTANTYIEIVGNGSLSSPANARTLDWSGNQWLAGSSTAQTFNAVSDRRLKENIKDYKCKKSILDLPIKEFDYKKNRTHAIGCIAQDLQEICPEIVNTDKDGYLSIQENKLVYLLLQEVKELKAEIDKLKEV